MQAIAIAIQSGRDNSADISIRHQHAAYSISGCAEVHGYIELSQDCGESLVQIRCDVIQQKCRGRL
jgi:hypothetical protein